MTKPDLGFAVVDLTQDGAPIIHPDQDGPAAGAGLVDGDVLITLDGLSPATFRTSPWWPRPNGAPINVAIMRGGVRITALIGFGDAAAAETDNGVRGTSRACFGPGALYLGFVGAAESWPYRIRSDSAIANAGLIPQDIVKTIAVESLVLDSGWQRTNHAWLEFAVAYQWFSHPAFVTVSFQRGHRRHEVRFEAPNFPPKDEILPLDTPSVWERFSPYQQADVIKRIAEERRISPEIAEEWLRDEVFSEIAGVLNTMQRERRAAERNLGENTFHYDPLVYRGPRYDQQPPLPPPRR